LTAVVEVDVAVGVEPIVDLDVDLGVRSRVEVQGQRWESTSNVAVDVKVLVKVIVKVIVKISEASVLSIDTSSVDEDQIASRSRQTVTASGNRCGQW
jgi:hypothetical protein